MPYLRIVKPPDASTMLVETVSLIVEADFQWTTLVLTVNGIDTEHLRPPGSSTTVKLPLSLSAGDNHIQVEATTPAGEIVLSEPVTVRCRPPQALGTTARGLGTIAGYDRRVDPNADDLSGLVLKERYRLIRKAGFGGFGTVYEARDSSLFERMVAVKFYTPADRTLALAGDSGGIGQFRDRFLGEAKILAGLDHPHIITIHDMGSHEDTPYFVMEFVPETLADWIGEKRILAGDTPPVPPLDVNTVHRLFGQIGEALRYLHSRRPTPIIHRDLKPANVMITAEGVVKLVDFGIAKFHENHTRSHDAFGSEIYMAVEQRVDARTVDCRADIYAFGRMLCVVLLGQIPNPFGDISHLKSALKKLPPGWSEFILTAGAYLKENRFPNTQSMLDAFRCLPVDQTLTVTPDPAATHDTKQTKHKPVPAVPQHAHEKGTASRNANDTRDSARVDPDWRQELKTIDSLVVAGDFQKAWDTITQCKNLGMPVETVASLREKVERESKKKHSRGVVRNTVKKQKMALSGDGMSVPRRDGRRKPVRAVPVSWISAMAT